MIMITLEKEVFFTKTYVNREYRHIILIIKNSSVSSLSWKWYAGGFKILCHHGVRLPFVLRTKLTRWKSVWWGSALRLNEAGCFAMDVLHGSNLQSCPQCWAVTQELETWLPGRGGKEVQESLDSLSAQLSPVLLLSTWSLPWAGEGHAFTGEGRDGAVLVWGEYWQLLLLCVLPASLTSSRCTGKNTACLQNWLQVCALLDTSAVGSNVRQCFLHS